MNIITKSKPELINHKIIKQLNKLFIKSPAKDLVWENYLSNFYTNYIKPNLFALIIFIIVGIFLAIKYYIKQDQDLYNLNKLKYKKKHHKKHSKKNVINKIPEQIFHIQQEHDESIDINDDENSIHKLHNEYEQAREQYKGIMSDEMIKEMYENKSAKSSFDDLARVISGSS